MNNSEIAEDIRPLQPRADRQADKGRSRKLARLHELDGIRGTAALSVLFFHVFWETLGGVVPAFRNPFTAGLMNGNLDVSIFFVVSGMALSAPFFQGGGSDYVLSAAIKRYVRLTVPIAAAVALMFVVSSFGLARSREAAQLLLRQDWLGLIAPTEFSLKDAVSWALADVYANPAIGGPILPFLWTMPIEMVGSMVLFVALGCYSSMQRPERSLTLIALVLLALFPYLAAFFIGALISQWKILGSRNLVWQAARLLANPSVRLIAAIGAYGVSCYFMRNGALHQLTVLLAAFCVILILNAGSARKFFAYHPLARFLGAISFPLYLVHYIVIVTVASSLALFYRDNLDPWHALAIGSVAVAASICAAAIFAPIEKLALSLSRLFESAVRGS